MNYSSIQVLRCLAVISVLLHHSASSVNTLISDIPFFSKFGWIGVNLFFVISGFIISDRIAYGKSLGRFLLRRYLRVFPLYALVTMTALLIGDVVGKELFTAARTDSGAAFQPGGLYVFNSLFIVPQDAWPVLMVGWSLEYEVVFYFSFGVAFFIGGRIGALTAMLAMTMAGMLIPGITQPFVDSTFVYFLLGCLAREALHSGSRSAAVAAPYLCLSTGALWIAHLYGMIDLTPHGFGVAAAVCFAALIVFTADLERRRKAFQRSGLLVRIGDMSFTIYLMHWLIIRVVLYAVRDLDLSVTAAELVRVAVVIVIIPASWLVWRFVEVPINKTTRQWLRGAHRDVEA